MYKISKKIWNIFDKNQKTFFSKLCFFSVIAMILELVSIGFIVPIIYSLSQENFFEVYPIFNNINQLLGYPESRQLTIISLIVLFIIVFVKNIFFVYYYWLEGKFAFGTQENVSKKLFSTFIKKDYLFHTENNSADLITRIRTDTFVLREAIQSLLSLVNNGILLLGITTLLFFIEPLGFAFAIFVLIFFGSIFNYFSTKKSLEIGKIRQSQEILRTQKLQESFMGIKEIKTFSKQDYFIKSYEDLTKLLAKIYSLRHVILKLPRAFFEVVAVICIVFLTLFLFYGSENNTKIFATLGVFSFSAIRILPTLNGILAAANTFKFSQTPVEYISKNIENYNGKNHSNLNLKNKFKFNTSINFKNIYFKYSKRTNFILEDVNMNIIKGEKIVIAGDTGSGKSTLIDIILGIQKPTKGKILVDSFERELNENSWCQRIGYVPQSIYLFDETIKKNIAIGEDEKDINNKHFEKCLEISRLSEFVNKLPNKSNTYVGESGVQLSGGQKQRIGIARALYKNPDLIIFDEATNALDLNTEVEIYTSIVKELKGKTLIVVTHKKNFHNFSNKIIKVENNKIYEIQK